MAHRDLKANLIKSQEEFKEELFNMSMNLTLRMKATLEIDHGEEEETDEDSRVI